MNENSNLDNSEEEIESSEAECVLGFIQRTSSKNLYRHRFPSKLGGRPAWLDPVDIPNEINLQCQITGQIMHFLLQLYAPIFDNEKAFHRMIYIFISPKESALYEKGGCRVFRCQLPRNNMYYPPVPAPKSQLYPLELNKDLIPNDPWHSYTYERNENIDINKRLIKEYKIRTEYENDIDSTSKSQSYHPNDKQINDIKEDDLTFIEDDLTDDQKRFIEFTEVIKKAPEQVIRYCFEDGSEPCWPKKAPRPDNIPNCERCGAKRQFEFQVLPQIINYIEEEEEAISMDMSTIAIYSCSNSCNPYDAHAYTFNGSRAYAEEFAFVQSP